MKKKRIFLDRFTAGLDDMKRADQRDPVAVLRVLEKIKRFSVFEASDNDTIATTMTMLFERGYVKDIGGGYPWTNIEITEAGQQFINENTENKK